MIDFYSDELVFKRLKKFYEYELPLFVKECYEEFGEIYPNYYTPLSVIDDGSKKQDLFSYLESFVRDNYGIPFSINKYLPFHSPLLFHESTKDFGFRIDRNYNSLYRKHQYPEFDSIFNQCHTSVSSIVIKKKLKLDLELNLNLFKLGVKSSLKRFFIQGRARWELIVADQIKYHGIDKFPNCLNHEFDHLKYSISFHEKNGHLGSYSSNPNVDKRIRDSEDKLYSKLKSKSKFSYSDVLEEKLFSSRIPLIHNKELYLPSQVIKQGIIKIADPVSGLGEIPLIKLKRSSSINIAPIELPIDFKLNFSDVFSDKSTIQEYLQTFNEPENGIRQSLGLPLVGEGWISETNLFYEIKNHFNSELVIHHGKPSWLGRQHLDIFLPELNIAIEYQGAQHYKPIEFFGGKQGLKKNKERDERKRNLCEINGCDLIYVYPEYDLENVIKKISLALNAR